MEVSTRVANSSISLGEVARKIESDMQAAGYRVKLVMKGDDLIIEGVHPRSN